MPNEENLFLRSEMIPHWSQAMACSECEFLMARPIRRKNFKSCSVLLQHIQTTFNRLPMTFLRMTFWLSLACQLASLTSEWASGAGFLDLRPSLKTQIEGMVWN